MPQTFNKELEDTTEDDFLDSIGEQDYVFILDKDGELKTVLLPDEFEDNHVPEAVQKILKTLGIDRLQSHTLH